MFRYDGHMGKVIKVACTNWKDVGVDCHYGVQPGVPYCAMLSPIHDIPCGEQFYVAADDGMLHWKSFALRTS